MNARLTRVSPITGQENTLELATSQAKVDEWERLNRTGPLVQDFFPELSAPEREFILTGITPSEWTEMFGRPEDLDDAE